MDIRVLLISEELLGCTRKPPDFHEEINLGVYQTDDGIPRALKMNDEILIYDEKCKKFDGVTCKKCDESIYGSTWINLKNKYSYCTFCFFSIETMQNLHFIRIDSPTETGIYVGRNASEYSNKCYGITKGSDVMDLFDNCEKVIDFESKHGLPRSFVKLKRGIKKYGYEGLIDVHLAKGKIKNKTNEHRIIKNNLRIFNRPVYLNYDILKKYKADISEDLLNNKTEKELGFKVGDQVYVFNFDRDEKYDCNYDIGKVKSLPSTGDQINYQIHLSNTSIGSFHPSQLHKIQDTEDLVKLIQSEKDFLKAMETWKQEFDQKTCKFSWIPDGSMFKFLKNRVGVAQSFTKTGNIILVKYFWQPYNFYILLPKTVCNIVEKMTTYNDQTDPALKNLYEAIEIDDEEKLKEEIEKKDPFDDYDKLILQSLKSKSSKCFDYLKGKTDPIPCFKYCLKRNILSLQHTEFIITKLESMELKPLDFDELALCCVKRNDLILLRCLTEKCPRLLRERKVDLKLDLVFNVILDTNNNGLIDLLIKNFENFNINFQYKKFSKESNTGCDNWRELEFVPDDTLLHICIRNGYIAKLCKLLEHFKDKVDIKIFNEKGNSLSHEAALFTDAAKWEQMCNTHPQALILGIREKFEKFGKTKGIFIDQKLFDMPHCMITILIFENVKKSFSEREKSINQSQYTPMDLLKASIKEFNKDVSVNVLLTPINLIYKEQIPEKQMCQFCRRDYATVTYYPCKHTLYCRYCAFMPDVCNKKDCGKDIEKCTDSSSNETVRWNDIEKMTNHRNLIECIKEYNKWKQDQLCMICNDNYWDTVFQCGHYTCGECCKKISGKCTQNCNNNGTFNDCIKLKKS